jgi:hypothetical protein
MGGDAVWLDQRRNLNMTAFGERMMRTVGVSSGSRETGSQNIRRFYVG